MKIRAFAIVIIFLFGTSVYGGGNFIIEAKGNYFHPSEKAFQDIYCQTVEI